MVQLLCLYNNSSKIGTSQHQFLGNDQKPFKYSRIKQLDVGHRMTFAKILIDQSNLVLQDLSIF